MEYNKNTLCILNHSIVYHNQYNLSTTVQFLIKCDKTRYLLASKYSCSRNIKQQHFSALIRYPFLLLSKPSKIYRGSLAS